MMIALAKTRPQSGLELIEKEVPQIGDNEILIKVNRASICGSDVHAYIWDEWSANEFDQLPVILGHEVGGIVVEIGKNVKYLKVGDKVAIESHFWCEECYNCRNGNFHVCKNIKILGFQYDGGFAEYMKIPYKNAIKVPQSIPLDFIPLMEPMGNAVDTVLSEDVASKNIIIVGCGPIGLMGIAISKASGANLVIATDINELRLNLAKKMGADIVVNPNQENLYEKVMDLTQGNGVDVLLEFSGNSQGFIEGMKTLCEGGRVSLLGLHQKPFEFDFNKYFIMKGVRIYSIIGRKIYSTWYKTIRFLESKQVNLEPIITHRIKLKDFNLGFSEILNKKAGKVLFEIG